MRELPIERCCYCNDATGRAGKGEDSLYCEHCDAGPFCGECFDEHMIEEEQDDDQD